MTASKPFLFDAACRELEQDSAIDPAVIAERGYESIHRPTNGDQRQRQRLQALQIPTWAIKEDAYFPGLLIPMYGPTGRRVQLPVEAAATGTEPGRQTDEIRLTARPNQPHRRAPVQ